MNKIMKKSAIGTALVCVFSLLISSQSFGQTLSTQASAGTLVTITPVAGIGQNVTFSPSPNVLMAITSTTYNFAIQAMNANIADGYRNEYAIWNGNTGYYQMVNGDMANASGVDLADFTVTLTATYDITSSPYTGDTWVVIGGGS